MPSIERMSKNELLRDLKVARAGAAKAREAERAAKAAAKKEVAAALEKAKQIPIELELMRKEVASVRRRERLDTGVQALLLSAARTALTDWDGKVTLPPPVNFQQPKEEVVAVAHLTDIQLGKKTESYCTEIAEGRMMEYARKVASCCAVHNKNRGIRELHVYFGGDMVEGDGTIFPKQQFSIDSSVLEQAVINGPRIFSAILLYWTRYFQKIVIKCVRGNHGRSGKKHDDGHPYTNWDTVLYLCTQQMLEKLLLQNGVTPKQCSIEWDISSKWYAVDEVLGHKNLLIHGDVGIRGSLGFPWYGTQKKMGGWFDAVKEPWDHLYLGHFHQYVSFDWNNHMVFAGGTPESDNEFARAELAATGRPKQRLQLWTARNGPIVDLPIYLNYRYEQRLPYSQKRRSIEPGAT